jgi:glycosyltransferase involved in cell wall biosynthesis
MRICYLGDASSPHVRKFVEYFAKTGNEIHVVSLRKAKYRNATLYLIPRRTPFEDVNYLLSFFWLRRIIKSIKPDIVHAHFLTSFGLLGALTGYHPFVVTAWGSDLLITPKRSFVYKWLLKFTLKKADLIFADAGFMKEEVLQYEASPEKVLIRPFGVNMEIFNSKTRVYEDRARYVILSMRTLIKNSNVDMIIKAMKILKEKGIDFVLNITNQGTEEQYLRCMACDLGLDSQVNFLGFLKRGDVYRFFDSSDIYLSIPTSDGASVTLLEAMASGLFPIVSDIAANREWIKDGLNGFLVPLNDPITLANRIILSVRKKGLRRKAAEVNRILVARKGELTKTMEFIGSQYKMLADSRRLGSSRPGGFLHDS